MPVIIVSICLILNLIRHKGTKKFTNLLKFNMIYNQPLRRSLASWLIVMVLASYAQLSHGQKVAKVFDASIAALDTLSDGQLLVALADGQVFAYDGHRFDTYTDRLPAVHDLLPWDHAHLALTARGIYYLLPHSQKLISPLRIDARAILPPTHIIATPQGPYQLADHTLSPLDNPHLRDTPVTGLLTHRDTTYLYGEKVLLSLPYGDTLYSQSIPMRSVVSHQGQLLIADDTGLYALIAGRKRQMILDGQVISAPVTRLQPLGPDLIISTPSKSYRWQPKAYTLQRLDHKLSYLDQEVHDVQIDAWQQIWVAQGKVLYSLPPARRQALPPRLQITEVSQNGRLLALDAQPYRFRKEENDLEVRCSAIHLGQDKISLHYRLGPQQPWQAMEESSLRLQDLPPARYSLELKATDSDGQVAYSRPLAFGIADDTLPWWYWWVLGLGGLSLALAAWAWQRQQSQRDSYQREMAKLKAENKALAASQKALQLQMNPHFVFNAINSIRGQLALGQTDAANASLQRFATIMRSVLQHSRRDWVALSDVLNYLRDYLYLEQVCRPGIFDFDIVVPEELDPEDVEVPPMLVQPFVENAVIHGVAPLKGGGHIRIAVEDQDALIRITISDNGVGYDPKASASSHESVALQVVSERLSQFRNRSARYTLVNLANEGGQGTRVEVYLPAR